MSSTFDCCACRIILYKQINHLHMMKKFEDQLILLSRIKSACYNGLTLSMHLGRLRIRAKQKSCTNKFVHVAHVQILQLITFAN